ncbi:MAG: RtcB family protein [Bacteroidetes bacterium]|nr:RtcB family protein [Bacteroidota bacterium]
MAKLKLKSKNIRSLGYPEGPVISIAMNVMEKNYKFEKEDNVMNLLREILASPMEYENDAVLGLIAQQLLPKKAPEGMEIFLNKTGVAFNVFGNEHVGPEAMNQMYQAAKLPVATAGALMPDAHSGYGLPIGGVLAVDNAVIPYGVGLDIGCRMHLSVFDIDPKDLLQKEAFFVRELKAATLFGGGRQFDRAASHEVLERSEFEDIALLRGLRHRAARQLGSSGSGNHFVEFGQVQIDSEDPVLGLKPGKYLGLLSHSGSRSLGAAIANHYTRIARAKRRLPGEVNHLAWLDLDEQEGMEYWLAMNLAGDYAEACHELIHDKLAKAIGRKPIRRAGNHHNFAWKEQHDGREVIVHRKGATPAGTNVLGIIPGSMTASGYIVKGKGEPASLSSASHGAGRKMSRSAASASISEDRLNAALEAHGVRLIGGGLDEAPQAYKDIEEVMKSQKQLVEVLGLFTPKIVRMAD